MKGSECTTRAAEEFKGPLVPQTLLLKLATPDAFPPVTWSTQLFTHRPAPLTSRLTTDHAEDPMTRSRFSYTLRGSAVSSRLGAPLGKGGAMTEHARDARPRGRMDGLD